MKKVKFRNVKELYGASGEVFDAKITPVRNGSHRMQGPADAADHIAELNMPSDYTGKGAGNQHCSSGKLHVKEESGSCDMSASPSSSFLLSEQQASPVGRKTDGDLSDNTSREKVCSHVDPDILSGTSSGYNRKQHLSSEISNHASASSSHDSFSENEESKDTPRASDISVCTEVKVDGFQTASTNLKAAQSHERHFSNQCQTSKEMEAFSDNISCISGSKCSEKVTVDSNSDIEKNVEHSSASVDCYPSAEKAVDCVVARKHVDVMEKSYPRNQIKLNKESLKAVDFTSNKLDLSEISSEKNSHFGASSMKGEPSECSVDQVEPPLARVETLMIHNQMHDVKCYMKTTKCEVNDGEVAAELDKSLQEKENFKLPIGDESNACGNAWQTQQVNQGDASGHLEDEVKVCDICGDVGREDMLAICSKCNDGAEHIYCMRVKLNKVPEGEWMCEECVEEDEIAKQRHDEYEKDKTVRLKGSSLTETELNAGNSNTDKKILEMKNKSLDGNKVRKFENSYHLPVKRPLGNAEDMSMTKRRAVIESASSPKPSKFFIKAGAHLDNAFKKLGCLSKSKSFNSVDSKLKFQHVDGGAEKQNFAKGSVVTGNVKSISRVLGKSKSLNNASFNRISTGDSKVRELPFRSANIEDLKRSVQGKERNSVVTKIESRLHSPSATTPGAYAAHTSCSGDRIVKPCVETRLVPLSRPKCQAKSSSSPKSASGYHHRDSVSEKQYRLANDVIQDAEHPKVNNSSPTLPSGQLSSGKDIFIADIPSLVSTIPRLDYIWQGGFQIQRRGSLSSCDGMQAHLSTSASPKVLEVVEKFPQKILVEQVPRLSMWPSQFQENQAKEDNIALYFFAEDLKSYETNYKGLLESMTRGDLGLRGNVNGVELLIFSSTLLPEKSQRWNKFFFLWGVFKARRINCQEGAVLRETACTSSLNLAPSGSQNKSFFLHSSDILHTSNSQSDEPHTLHSLSAPELLALSSERQTKICKNEETSPQCKISDREKSDRQLIVADALVKNEQLPIELQYFQGKERDSKRKHEIDLNRECDVDGFEDDEELVCKRMRKSGGMVKCDDLGSSGDGRVYNNLRYTVDSGLVENRSAVNTIPQLVSARHKKQLQSTIQSFISSGAERRSSREPGIMTLFPEILDHEDKENKHSGTMTSVGNGDCSPCLSLSLALPFTEEKAVSRTDSEVEQLFPGCDGIDTSLSLFGNSRNC
ncbi:hypothetical protein K2173_016870 [Erythroxylum novogranatense]|uniref:PHD-type domain-containing protein n=1 Tax=Erythroxylum novogranatense TaxID=1862640 RepID=A0AAV8U8B6_9ROSI|nr:hypothetical protein K2173_016870 [Erythroxylum novogranatense]